MSIPFQSNEILLMNSDDTHVRMHARAHARTHPPVHLTHKHMLTIETNYRVLIFFLIEFVLGDKKYRGQNILNPLPNLYRLNSNKEFV